MNIIYETTEPRNPKLIVSFNQIADRGASLNLS